jgi:hypothetical protein
MATLPSVLLHVEYEHHRSNAPDVFGSFLTNSVDLSANLFDSVEMPGQKIRGLHSLFLSFLVFSRRFGQPGTDCFDFEFKQPPEEAPIKRVSKVRSLQATSKAEQSPKAQFAMAEVTATADAVAQVQDNPVTASPAVPLATAAVPTISRQASAIWTAKLEEKLIDLWGEIYVRLDRGNLPLRHWNEITSEVNVSLPENEVLFTVKQIRTKIDALKSKFKDEKSTKTATGSVNSSWSHFTKMATFIAGTPKVCGIPNARDCGESSSEPPIGGQQTEAQPSSSLNRTAMDALIGEEDPELQELSPLTKIKSNSKEHIKGARNKRKRSDSSSGRDESDIAASMNKFTEVYADVATKHMDILRELVANKAEMQRQLARDKTEMDLKILDMQLRFTRNGGG